MAQAVSRRPLNEAARVRSRVNPVGFVVDKLELGHVSFSESFGFPLSISFHRELHISENKKKNSSFTHPFHSHPGTNKRPVKAAADQ
jgi:hypothetical protein